MSIRGCNIARLHPMNFTQEHLVNRADFSERMFHELGFTKVARDRTACPLHGGSDSVSMNFDTTLWECKSAGCGYGGDLVTAYSLHHGIDTGEAIEALKEKLGIDDRHDGPTNGSGKIVRSYAYEIRDVTGKLVATKHRREHENGDKKMAWQPGPGGLSIASIGAANLPLYHTDLIPSWPPTESIFLTEGEKKCDALIAAGFHAVATVTGSSKTPSNNVLSILRNRDVILWPDLDDPGVLHMTEVGRGLWNVAKSLRWLTWGQLPGDDAGNFFARGGTADELRRLTTALPDWVPEEDESAFTIVSMDSVAPRSTEWLWEGMVPFGTLTGLQGETGVGKSTVCIDLMARLSRGDLMPDGSPGLGVPVASIYLSAEDDPETMIRPRLDAAGADPKLVHLARPGKSRFGNIEEDWGTIDSAIIRKRARLVVIDPVSAYLPKDSEGPNSESGIRQALMAAIISAQHRNIAVIGLRHLGKSHREHGALIAGLGSMGFPAVCRSFLTIGEDRTTGNYAAAQAKSNLCKERKSVSFTIVGTGNFSRIIWSGESDATADDIVFSSGAPERPEERSLRANVVEALREALAGGPAEAKAIMQRLGEAFDVTERTVQRAAASLKVKSHRSGYRQGSRVIWTLPDTEVPPSPPDVSPRDSVSPRVSPRDVSPRVSPTVSNIYMNNIEEGGLLGDTSPVSGGVEVAEELGPTLGDSPEEPPVA